MVRIYILVGIGQAVLFLSIDNYLEYDEGVVGSSIIQLSGQTSGTNFRDKLPGPLTNSSRYTLPVSANTKQISAYVDVPIQLLHQ